ERVQPRHLRLDALDLAREAVALALQPSEGSRDAAPLLLDVCQFLLDGALGLDLAMEHGHLIAQQRQAGGAGLALADLPAQLGDVRLERAVLAGELLVDRVDAALDAAALLGLLAEAVALGLRLAGAGEGLFD